MFSNEVSLSTEYKAPYLYKKKTEVSKETYGIWLTMTRWYKAYLKWSHLGPEQREVISLSSRLLWLMKLIED